MAPSTLKAIVLTLKSRKHLLIVIAASLLMMVLSVYIPSVLTPGNTIAFQLLLLTFGEAALIILFSLLFGLSIGMQLYASALHKMRKGVTAAKSTGTGIAAFAGTLFSAKLCPICLSALLAYIGIGGSAALLLFSYKTEILVASMLVLLASMYFAGKRITVSCERCAA